MEIGLWILCSVLLLIIAGLLIKLHGIRKAADELASQFADRLTDDTNAGIYISSSDRNMRKLAADIDRQLKLLRKEQIRYTRGDQELKNAITNISHDLRTPLTAVCGYMDLLSGEEAPDQVKAYLSIIENRIQALKGLTEELFRYSVIMSSDSYESREELDLNRILEESIAAFYAAFKEAGIKPEIRMPEAAVSGRLNRQAVSRIFSNIISNAVKYSDGDFAVHLEQNGTIYFKNRADRLDQVQVEHLFDRFFTVENGRNATGLGISIAKALTEEMNGQMAAKLTGGILTITVRFPVEMA